MYALRKLENFHLLLWLIKDLCWVSEWTTLGVFMVLPTVGMAIYILITTRKRSAVFFYNLAVLFWITANSIWMLYDFFESSHTWTHAAMLGVVRSLFLMGLGCIVFYHTRRFWLSHLGR